MAKRPRRKEVIYKAERPRSEQARQPASRPRHQNNVVKPDSRANRSLLWRVIALMCVCGAAMFIPLGAQLYKLQVKEHDYYKELGVRNQTRDVAVTAGRGDILDCNGEIMAVSGTVYKLILSPRDALEKQETIDEQVEKNPEKYDYWNVNEAIVDYLTDAFDLEESYIRSCLDKTKVAYLEVVKEIPEEDADEIRKFIRDHKLTQALYLTPDSKRFYPNGSVASHVLGFMSQNESSGDRKVGAYGIEAFYEEELAGKPGRVVTAKNAAGTQMLSSYQAYMDAEEGGDVTLTVDEKIQAMAEQALKTAIEKYYVQKGGQITVINPQTGAILANAVYPNYDPNDRFAITDPDVQEELELIAAQSGTDSEAYKTALNAAVQRQWRNTSILDTYEPGSTFKPFVVAAALEEGVVNMNSTFYCSGVAHYGGVDMHCHKLTGHGSEDLTGVLENSCNPAMMKIGVELLGAEKMWQYFEDYGLMDKTGVDMGGDVKGIFWDGGKDYFTSLIGESSVATASFGQRFNITPLRMISSFASLINGGHLLTPYFVQTITDKDGTVTYEHQTEEIRQVISEETSEKIRTMLESVVANPEASGKNAYCAGYRIGGKTGTAEKVETPRTTDVVCSFIGFAPADNPQILVLGTFDSPLRQDGGSLTPGGTYIAGGNIAAPTVGPLIAQILDYMGIEKQYANSSELSKADVIVPALTGKTLEEATELLQGQNLTVRAVGDGESVTAQIPAAGASIPGGSAVAVYLGTEAPTDTVTVPNLVGMSPRAVETSLNNLGLYIRATGVTNYSGATSSIDQTIAAGTEVARGTVVEVRFADAAIGDSTVQ